MYKKTSQPWKPYSKKNKSGLKGLYIDFEKGTINLNSLKIKL